jgi:nucleoside-diphosphate-sugar epimerase
VSILNIFLTGSTGFLGGNLINNLISGTNNELFMLVRNLEKAVRLRNQFQVEEQQRIHFLKGDITLPYCGLTEVEIVQLQDNVDVFYHLAALVKFDLDLRDELFSVNYDGTHHALQLAKRIRVNKFLYVSTAYTVGKKQRGVETLYSPMDEYHNPYEESKVKSEHLVFSYADDMDVSIFRPSIIVGDSKTGEADSEFTLYGFMRALDLFKRKVARRAETRTDTYRLVANKNGTSNLVPVDYVADVLNLAASKAEKNKIYNITNPNPPKNIELISMLKKALAFDQLSVTEDTEQVELNPEEEKLNGMVDIFQVYLSGAIQFDDDHTQKLIRGSRVNHLQLTPEMVQMIMNAYFSTQLEKV